MENFAEYPKESGAPTPDDSTANPSREEKLKEKKSDFKESGYGQTDASTPGIEDQNREPLIRRKGSGLVGNMGSLEEEILKKPGNSRVEGEEPAKGTTSSQGE